MSAAKHQDPAIRAHFRAFGIDRSIWFKMRTALKVIEDHPEVIDKATAAPITVSDVRRVFDVLANGPRGELKGKR